MNDLKIDREYLRMIVDYYERKCPCWGGKYTCPCPPFAQTQECRCGAIRKASDRKASDQKYKPFAIDFPKLANLVKDHKCSEDGRICFCHEFLETGKCKVGIFKETY